MSMRTTGLTAMAVGAILSIQLLRGRRQARHDHAPVTTEGRTL